MKNILGVEITRPIHKLIICRGVSGSGKSTKAKSLVENGIIHSTDSVIELMGDYNDLFNKMNETKDFSLLQKAHKINLNNAISSMIKGLSPIIIDNTNLRPSEPKQYVIEALKMGYDDKNIIIMDIGTANLTAEELANRNKHNVPLNKIKMMIERYNSVGKLTIENIINSKDMEKKSNVSYSGVILDSASRIKLLSHLTPYEIPVDWKIFCHHMTINLGPLKDKSELGKKVKLVVTHVGLSDMAMAAKVEGYHSDNKIPHITIAINVKEGGKPKMSNEIKEWGLVKPFGLTGTIKEIEF